MHVSPRFSPRKVIKLRLNRNVYKCVYVYIVTVIKTLSTEKTLERQWLRWHFSRFVNLCVALLCYSCECIDNENFIWSEFYWLLIIWKPVLSHWNSYTANCVNITADLKCVFYYFGENPNYCLVFTAVKFSVSNWCGWVSSLCSKFGSILCIISFGMFSNYKN